MPRHSGGSCAPISVVTTAPQSPPCAKNLSYPRRLMRFTHAVAIRVTPQPVERGLSAKPKPGSEGTTTGNESATLPPYALGFVSGPITSKNSMTDPGHPCVKISGTALEFGDFTCKKCIPRPSIIVRDCPSELSRASHFLQL